MSQEFFSSAATRLLYEQRTVRRYKAQLPSEELLRECISLAQRAPSTSNHQPYSVFQLQDQELRGAILRELVCQPYVFDAPVLLLVCVDWSRQDALAEELGTANCINQYPESVT